MLGAVAAISLGAALGALLRWTLTARLAAAAPGFPYGTLASNLVGGYLVGCLVAWLAARASLPPEVRLFAITGFCGGLTTFSAFSAEVVDMLQKGHYGPAALVVALNVGGSIAMTFLGFATWRGLGPA